MSASLDADALGAPQIIPPTARANEAAIVSICCALVLPLTAAQAFLTAHGPAPDSTEMTLRVLLALSCPPAAVAAVVSGHQALLRANRLPAARAHRRLAWCGLLGGYLCAAIIFGARIAPLLPALTRPNTVHVSTVGASGLQRVRTHLPSRAGMRD
jgi:hypothetical protein